jgi:hypothetical protein
MHAPKKHYVVVQCIKVYILGYCNVSIFVKIALFNKWHVNFINMITNSESSGLAVT